MTDNGDTTNKDLADELERLARALDYEPDAARRIYRSLRLSLSVEHNLPAILSALRSPTGEGEPVAWRWRAIFDDASRGGWFYETGPLSRDIYTRQALEHQPLYTRPVACPACYRGEVFGLSTDDGFWVEMGASAGGAHEHGMNGWLELIEHNPDGTEKRREYVATDSPLYTRPQPVACPEGYKLVPVETLEDMLGECDD